jgi:hypothetical protein
MVIRALLLLLLSAPVFAAVTESGTSSTDLYDIDEVSDWSSRVVVHTVPSGAEALVCSIFMRGNDATATTIAAEWDDGGTDEAMTSVDETAANDNGGDLHVETFIRLSPTAATSDVTFTATGGTVDTSSIICTNWDNVDTTDVATATNVIGEEVNNTNSTTCEVASGGTTGNLLYAAIALKHSASEPSPPAYSESWAAVDQTDSTVDNSTEAEVAVVAAASAYTATLANTVSDESACHVIELVEGSAASVVPLIHHHNMQMGQ